MKSLSAVATEEQRRILTAAETIARRDGLRVWVVGGPVRDALLGRPLGDLDFTLEQRASEFAAALAGELGASVRRFDEFMTSRVNLPSGEIIDVATTRAEHYTRPGALPIVAPAGIGDDLKRRDFTVNAIALELTSRDLEDPFGGVADLQRRLLRILHRDSFRDDPTRIFRGLRLAARLGFEIEPETAARMGEALDDGAMESVSRERRWRELRLAMSEPDPVAVLSALAGAGALDPLLGAIRRGKDLRKELEEAWNLASIRPDLDREILLLAALSPTLPELRGSGLSSRKTAALRQIIERQAVVDRLQRDDDRRSLASAAPELLALLEREPATREVASRETRVRATRLPFGGDELDLPPGPHLGRALRETREAIVDGHIDESGARAFARDRALEYLRSESS